MPSSQAPAAERRNDRMITHEPPKLKTTLTTPPKQATNPLQFVKVGPCPLYRSATDQLTKVEEVKKVKQEVREEAEDWQSNLDNWKSSRRKRQEHIIERVVEVKKLELEEHDRQRRRSKTFSEMMEERGSRGRKLSMSLAMYHEEDSNDLSDLGIGTSSGKSSISGDTHDDTQSVLSDRDSEIDKNHSDLDNTTIENGNNTSLLAATEEKSPPVEKVEETLATTPAVSTTGTNGFHNDDHEQREYDSGTTATVSSPEPEEYTYEGAIRGYVSRVAQNIPRRSLVSLDTQLDSTNKSSKINLFDDKNSSTLDVLKIDIHKRREMFEKASQQQENTNDNKTNNNIQINRSSGDFTKTISIKERLSCLEKQKNNDDDETLNDKNKKKTINRLPGDMSSIRERLTNLEKKASDRENKISRKSNIDEYVEPIIPLRERLSTLEKYSSTSGDESPSSMLRTSVGVNDAEKKPTDKQLLRFNNNNNNNIENLTPSERSSSPDSEYRASRTAFHRSLDSLDADASSGPDTFERVQSLEELDYVRRYTGSVSSAEILNDTDREDSGIHTADVSCSVSQADEPVDEDIVQDNRKIPASPATEGQVNFTETKRIIEQIDNDVPLAVITEESIVIGGGSVDKEINESLVDLPVESSSSSVEHEEVPRVCQLTVDTRIVQLPASHVDQKIDTSMENILKHDHKSIVQNSCEDKMNLLTFDQPILQKNSIQFLEPLSPISKQIPQFNMTSDEEIVTGLAFPLGPPSSVEPPKEKPPPPPTDFSDEENQPLKRLNSTRRIKKEMRTRRSDFLGIEGINDDDLEFSLVKPPNMAAILAEERRIEQLHRRSYDTDSNYEQDSSHERDSGVELGHAEDWVKQPVSPDMSQHSRQSSEPFGASVTSSEEDEITKKEREIIEVLEKEEQWRYGNDREQNSDIGEKLAHKLRKLEEEKMQLERERAHETKMQQHKDETMRMNDENTEDILRVQQQQQQQEMTMQQQQQQQQMMEGDEMKMREKEQLRIHDEMLEKERRSVDIRRQEDIRLQSMEKQLREQEKTVLTAVQYNHEDDYASGEVLRVERELLQLEQEELKRQRTNLAYREQKQQQLAEQLQEQWQSLQDVAHASPQNSHATYQNISVLNYRSSMPNLQLQEHGQRRRPPPPPIPPAKPLRLPFDQRQRDVTIRNSRIPSADNIPQQVCDTVSLRHSVSVSTLGNNYGGQQQQMTKQTLQALSAVPRTRIVKGDQWVQRRKSDGPRVAQDLNYQHWLIQEAEQRRINEKNQRLPARKSQQHVTGTSVPYTATPTRSDGGKPLPDSIIQTLTQRMQNRAQERLPPIRRRLEHSVSQEQLSMAHHHQQQQPQQQHTAMVHQKVHQLSNSTSVVDSQEKLLSVSGKKKCSHCGDELGRGAAMIIESLRLFYHMECFKCCVCHMRLGDGLMGTDVRVRNHKLHCHNCYSSDDGVKFSCV